GAVQTFVTQGQVAAPRFDSQLTFDLANTSVVLEGTVANLSDLRLTDVVLLAPGQGNVQRLGDFEPNETKNVSLSLLNSHAAQAPSNVVTPIFSFPRGVSPPSYVPSNYDSTIDDILGNSNYYSDKTQYRRYALLSAAIDTYNGGGRGGGVYLVGWTDSAPVSAEVLERTFSTLDSSVYFVNLRPKVNLGEGTLTLPPGLMNWLVLDPGQAGSPTPYGMYLYQGYDYALRFVPAQPIPFRRVHDLTLHLTSYGAGGPTGLNIYLWDFEQSTWVEQPAPDWGDTTVASPERFVGPAGEIHVRVVNPAAPQVSIEALDFTLVVER
ncbi:MAG: hypothetical protein ACRDH2_15015, partial [Anaerolineales bacterium]